jgi:mannan endo-1,4-beta-mannosidase
MRKKTAAMALAVVTAAAAATATAALPAQAAVGIHVSGTTIVEANGTPFVMRGTSHAHVWYPTQTKAFADIASLGANTVRVVLGGGRWGPNSASDVANVISLCKASKLICMLEVHDTTGYGEDSAATSLSSAVSYWKSIKSALDGQENYILINIGNEPYGNTNQTGWIADTTNAVKAMRSAGFQHALVVDAPGWGQDNNGVMRDNAAAVEAADPQKNTIFSVHMYSVYSSASTITSYVSAFKAKGLPLIIGEFGFKDPYGDIDEDTVMATAQSQGIGYLGWSWSGNSGGVEYLDQATNFNVNQLTSWGTRLFNGTNGISSTAKRATVYGGPVPTSSTTTTPTSTVPTTSGTTSPPPGGADCTATLTVASSWSNGFVANVTVRAGSAAISGWKVTLALPSGVTVSNLWNGQLSGTTVTNASYNGSVPASGTASFGFQGTGPSTGVGVATCTATR